MSLTRSASRSLAALALVTAVAVAPAQRVLGQAPEARARLKAAATDPKLAPWQRDLMSRMADGETASDDGAWGELTPSGMLPAARYSHTAIYDPLRDRMLIFGGWDGNTPLNDTWALSLAGTPAWSQLTPSGTPPAARYSHTAIYDPLRDRMVIFGGFDGQRPLNNLWVLSLAGSPAWTELSPLGALPDPRYTHTAIYDPLRDRMLIFGGYGYRGYLNDVWAFSMAGSPAWTQLGPSGTLPTARVSHTAIYDPVRDRMLTFGGYDSTYFNDVWALSLAGSPNWTRLTPGGILPGRPAARYTHSAIYDSLRDRMVIFGGATATSLLNDVWALSLASAPAWSQLAPSGSIPAARERHAAIHDPVRDGMLIFGGTWNEGYLKDAWALQWGATSVPDPTGGSTGAQDGVILYAPAPTPSMAGATIRFSLAAGGFARLRVYDVNGRLVRRLLEAEISQGAHDAVWDGNDDQGRAMNPGIYFYHLEAAGRSRMQKGLLVR